MASFIATAWRSAAFASTRLTASSALYIAEISSDANKPRVQMWPSVQMPAAPPRRRRGSPAERSAASAGTAPPASASAAVLATVNPAPATRASTLAVVRVERSEVAEGLEVVDRVVEHAARGTRRRRGGVASLREVAARVRCPVQTGGNASYSVPAPPHSQR